MSTWQDAPDASGLWWVRREGQPDDVLRVTRLDEHAVWISGTLCTPDMIRGWQWCRVVTPERVEALESALREVCEWVGFLPFGGERTSKMFAAKARALAVLRGATVAAPEQSTRENA